MPDKVAIDLGYVENATFANDIKIIFRTFAEIIKR